MPLSSFWYLTAEIARHEAEELRTLVLANFAKDPQELLERLDDILADTDETPVSGAAQVTSLLLALPSDAVTLVTKEEMEARQAEAREKQEVMDKAIASGDPAQVLAVIRQYREQENQ